MPNDFQNYSGLFLMIYLLHAHDFPIIHYFKEKYFVYWHTGTKRAKKINMSYKIVTLGLQQILFQRLLGDKCGRSSGMQVWCIYA